MSKTLREKYFEVFAENCVKAVELTRIKNLGYTGGTDDPFSNFRFAAQLASLPGKEPVTVAQTILSRMADKLSRFKSLVSRDSAGTIDESLVDTLNDLFVYSNLLQVWEQLGHPEVGTVYTDETATEALTAAETELPPGVTAGTQLAKLYKWFKTNV